VRRLWLWQAAFTAVGVALALSPAFWPPLLALLALSLAWALWLLRLSFVGVAA
jgi:hypothetical protein